MSTTLSYTTSQTPQKLKYRHHCLTYFNPWASSIIEAIFINLVNSFQVEKVEIFQYSVHPPSPFPQTQLTNWQSKDYSSGYVAFIHWTESSCMSIISKNIRHTHICSRVYYIQSCCLTKCKLSKHNIA